MNFVHMYVYVYVCMEPGVSSSGAAASLASYALSTCVCMYIGGEGGSTLNVRAPAHAKTRTNSPCVYTPVYLLTYLYVYVSGLSTIQTHIRVCM